MSVRNAVEGKCEVIQVEGKKQFGCPCGKKYLSYPALFTHVKQKHNGKAPGKLIKPKTEKPRGRPKIKVYMEKGEHDEGEKERLDLEYDIEEEVNKVLKGVRVCRKEVFECERGKSSCKNMGTAFIQQFQGIEEDKLNILKCLMNFLRSGVEQRYGQKYWEQESPSEIINITNQLCRNHQQENEKFPLPKQILIELVFILFRWMYRNKWTDHKLTKKN